MSTDVVGLAREIAQRAHAGQRYGRRDYFAAHLEPVAASLRAWGPTLEAAGYLHDVIEDTDETPSSLRRAGIPARVIEIVTLVTKIPGEDYFDRIEKITQDADAVRVKRADNYHNRQALALMPEGKRRQRLTERYEQARVLLESAT